MRASILHRVRLSALLPDPAVPSASGNAKQWLSDLSSAFSQAIESLTDADYYLGNVELHLGVSPRTIPEGTQRSDAGELRRPSSRKRLLLRLSRIVHSLPLVVLMFKLIAQTLLEA